MSQFNEVLNKKAVALKYDENRNAAPVIVASGMGYLAEKIVEVANDNGADAAESWIGDSGGAVSGSGGYLCLLSEVCSKRTPGGSGR